MQSSARQWPVTRVYNRLQSPTRYRAMPPQSLAVQANSLMLMVRALGRAGLVLRKCSSSPDPILLDLFPSYRPTATYPPP